MTGTTIALVPFAPQLIRKPDWNGKYRSGNFNDDCKKRLIHRIIVSFE